MNSGNGFKDDDSEPNNHNCRFVTFSPTFDSALKRSNADDPDFPVMYDFTTAIIEIPGLESLMGDFTDETGEEFLDWYQSNWKTWTDVQKYNWVKANTVYPGDKYDVFHQTEYAIAEFRGENDDVETYTVYLSSQNMGTLQSGRDAGEVLEYLAGGAASGRFTTHADEDTLKDLLCRICGLHDIEISDNLSEYVDFAEEPKLTITLKNDAYSDYYETGEDFAYLYKNGEFTTLGYLLLVTEADPSDAAAPYTRLYAPDTDNEKVSVVFKPGIQYSGKINCEASFTVKVNEHAEQIYISTCYGSVTGDADTDYQENATSSGKPGFHSNDGAEAKWKYHEPGSDDYDDPVVQVHIADIGLKKVDAAFNSPLKGAEFDLYVELAAEKTGCITYTDAAEEVHYLLKLNDETLVSGEDGMIEADDLKNLRLGRYYLFETKVPDGYMVPERPFVFRLKPRFLDENEDGKLEMSYAILPDGDNAAADSEDALLLLVRNRSGYELPSTGGRGTAPFVIGGTLMMALAALYLARRRTGSR